MGIQVSPHRCYRLTQQGDGTVFTLDRVTASAQTTDPLKVVVTDVQNRLIPIEAAPAPPMLLNDKPQSVRVFVAGLASSSYHFRLTLRAQAGSDRLTVHVEWPCR